MHIANIFFFEYSPYLVLSFFSSQVQSGDWDYWFVFITLPIYAMSYETDFAARECEASMATT